MHVTRKNKRQRVLSLISVLPDVTHASATVACSRQLYGLSGGYRTAVCNLLKRIYEDIKLTWFSIQSS